jgi:hypothetical protein
MRAAFIFSLLDFPGPLASIWRAGASLCTGPIRKGFLCTYMYILATVYIRNLGPIGPAASVV